MGTEVKMFRCNECSKTFTSKKGLNGHIQHHTGKYSYFCGLCRKGFPQACDYKRHMKRHEDING